MHPQQEHPAEEYPFPKTTPDFRDNYTDTASSSSSSPSSPYKPVTSFDRDYHLDSDFLDLEDGYISSSTAADKDWPGVQEVMTVRSRRQGSADSSVYNDEGKTLLDRAHTTPTTTTTTTRRRPRARTWWNYCIFGGISGMSILAILLTTNLLLAVVTLFLTTDPDDIFTQWGSINSGTEGLAWYPTDFTRDVRPIACHSHNDYWRRVPLFSALRHGCTGVEADVWLSNDDLFVGHSRASLTHNRTFTALYIDPLVEILDRQNPSTDFYNASMNGVFDVDPAQTLALLIDVKTSGAETWPWILKQLEPLRERGWLTFVEGETVHTRPVTVVGTGNTRFDILTQNETYRDTFFDAPLETMWDPHPCKRAVAAKSPSSPEAPDTQTASHALDLGQGLSGTTPLSSFTTLNSYYASVSLPKAIGRIWHGKLSDSQLRIIRGQVRAAHSRGLKARYWDLPSWPLGLRDHVWDVLVKEGVDVLNVDDLRAVSRVVW